MDISTVAELKIAIWGAAREGLAVTKKLLAINPAADITILNDQELTTEQINDFKSLPVKFSIGSDVQKTLSEIKVLIKSPGVSFYRKEIQDLIRSGCKITSGTNLWISENKDKKILAITGSKGKSTTSSICTEILRAEGLKAVCGGNIGKPLWDLSDEYDYYILELSSYQITDLSEHINAACLLNLYPAHQIWHNGEEQYYLDKCRIQNLADKFFINSKDLKVRKYINRDNISYYNDSESFALKNNFILNKNIEWFDCSQMKILGEHNYLNTCAALTLASFFTEISEKSRMALINFNAISHRLEKAGIFNGVSFINDSISTVPESAIAAVKAVKSQNLTLLIGGQDIEGNWKAFYEYIADNPIKNIITLPDNGKKIVAGFNKFLKDQNKNSPINLTDAEDLSQAISLAKKITPSGGTILLSPGTPSYGRFKNFEERGNLFKKFAAESN
jgi:UDP-N-acetylmuramoylalanine--D-glutamate ligase